MAGNILLSSIFLLLLPRFLASFEDLPREGGGGGLSLFSLKTFLSSLVPGHPRRPRGSQSRRDETKIGTGVKFSSKARRAPGNIPLTDEFQSELNSDFLIGRKFPQLSFFRPIREPHTMKSDRDFLYQVINTTSTVAIFFLSLSLSGSQNRHTMRRKFGSQRDPQEAIFNQFYLEDFVTGGGGQLSVHA